MSAMPDEPPKPDYKQIGKNRDSTWGADYYGDWMTSLFNRAQWLEAEIEKLKDILNIHAQWFEVEVEKLKSILIIVEKQAKDEGLWFVAQTAPEIYLQQQLRHLHEAIEGKSQQDCVRELLK